MAPCLVITSQKIAALSSDELSYHLHVHSDAAVKLNQAGPLSTPLTAFLQITLVVVYYSIRRHWKEMHKTLALQYFQV